MVQLVVWFGSCSRSVIHFAATFTYKMASTCKQEGRFCLFPLLCFQPPDTTMGQHLVDAVSAMHPSADAFLRATVLKRLVAQLESRELVPEDAVMEAQSEQTSRMIKKMNSLYRELSTVSLSVLKAGCEGWLFPVLQPANRVARRRRGRRPRGRTQVVNASLDFDEMLSDGRFNRGSRCGYREGRMCRESCYTWRRECDGSFARTKSRRAGYHTRRECGQEPPPRRGCSAEQETSLSWSQLLDTRLYRAN